MKKKKIPILQIARIITRIISVLLFPGFFILVFSSIGQIVTALFRETFSLSDFLSQILLCGAVLILTAFCGRFFCGFLCSFGAIADFLHFASRKLSILQIVPGKKADRLLKGVKYIVLAVIVAAVWILGYQPGTGSPWTVFGMYTSLSAWNSLSGFVSVGGLLLLLIFIGEVFVNRFFCRYLCPLGAIFAAISSLRLFRLKKPRSGCGACRACTISCPMAIPLSDKDVIASGECINCFSCISVCPRKNITPNTQAALVSAAAICTMAGLYYAGNLIEVSHEPDVSLVTSESHGMYSEGVYTGSSSGYRGTIQVQVTVENGFLEQITVLSSSDDSEFFSKAKNSVIPDMISTQSTEVDTVSGATFSSRGIINAVINALSGKETEVSSSEESSSVPEASSSESPSAGLTDGEYTGSGEGLRGTTSVTVTVEGGSITDITVNSYEDDTPYFSRAESKIISSVLSAQSVDVDTVSGATFSSNSILEAVANALDLSFENPNSTLAQGGHRH